MPLALDLISTLESGWILPVATTTRAKSPRSAEAILEGSIVRLGLSAALTPYPPPPRTATAIAAQMIRRRFLPFFPFFPFAKPLPLLDIPDPRSSGLAAISGYATVHKKFHRLAGLDDGRSHWSGPRARRVGKGGSVESPSVRVSRCASLRPEVKGRPRAAVHIKRHGRVLVDDPPGVPIAMQTQRCAHPEINRPACCLRSSAKPEEAVTEGEVAAHRNVDISRLTFDWPFPRVEPSLLLFEIYSLIGKRRRETKYSRVWRVR